VSHVSSAIVLAIARYLALVLDREIVCCFFHTPGNDIGAKKGAITGGRSPCCKATSPIRIREGMQFKSCFRRETLTSSYCSFEVSKDALNQFQVGNCRIVHEL